MYNTGVGNVRDVKTEKYAVEAPGQKKGNRKKTRRHASSGLKRSGSNSGTPNSPTI